MERKLSEFPNHTTWSLPDGGERKTPGTRKEPTENRKKAGEFVAAVQHEAAAKVVRQAAQESTIWQRPEARPAEEPHTARAVAAVAPEVETTPSAAENEPDIDAAILEAAFVAPKPQPEDSAWVESFASAPETPRDERQDESGRPALAQRSYFWTQPEVRQPNQTQELHDQLPAVPSIPIHPQEATVGQETRPAAPQVAPEFAEALNPNALTVGVGAEVEQPAPTQLPGLRAARSLLSRRGETRAQQSQATEAVPFEQAAAIPAEHSPFLEQSAPEAQNEALVPAALPEMARTDMTLQHEVLDHPSVAAENLALNPEHARVAQPAERILQSSELLTLAEAIRLNDVSVYEMFTAKRIDEAGLRRIVTEYLRGGNFAQVIAQEIRREEIKFERDPQLRATPVETLEERKARAAAERLKAHAKELFDLQRTKERTERAVEATQKQLHRAEGYIRHNPQAKTVASVLAIVAIYAAIFIVILSK